MSADVTLHRFYRIVLLVVINNSFDRWQRTERRRERAPRYVRRCVANTRGAACYDRFVINWPKIIRMYFTRSSVALRSFRFVRRCLVPVCLLVHAEALLEKADGCLIWTRFSVLQDMNSFFPEGVVCSSARKQTRFIVLSRHEERSPPVGWDGSSWPFSDTRNSFNTLLWRTTLTVVVISRLFYIISSGSENYFLRFVCSM